MDQSTATKEANAQTQNEAAPAAQEDAKKKPVKRKSARKERVTMTKSKRKTAVARASVKAGTGKIQINSRYINSIDSDAIMKMMLEPLYISDIAKEYSKKVDIKVRVYGGGVSTQMQAVRGAIAKGLVEFSDSDELKREYLRYNRSMMVDDTRRVEPKKFRGPKARTRFQTSYR